MSAPYNGAVGYKRPPKETQWKPGQCGNPKRQYRRKSKGTVEIIDDCFATPIEVVVNSRTETMSMFAAIFLQLWRKEMEGSNRAMSVRLRYEAFAASARGEQEVIIED